MAKEHGESGEFVETVTLEKVREVFDDVRGPVVLSADVADRLDCSRETARRKLKQLHDRGELERRKVSRRVLYWEPPGRQEADESAALESASAVGHDRSAATTGDEQGAIRGQTPDVDDVLRGWGADTETDAKTARAQTRRAVEFLRDRAPERFTKSEFQSALADGSALGKRSWWERAVQPGLRQLVDAGLVEYRAGRHDYRWVGDSAGQTAIEGEDA
jgi:DNA-binding MarR family transcriptional regulator